MTLLLYILVEVVLPWVDSNISIVELLELTPLTVLLEPIGLTINWIAWSDRFGKVYL